MILTLSSREKILIINFIVLFVYACVVSYIRHTTVSINDVWTTQSADSPRKYFITEINRDTKSTYETKHSWLRPKTDGVIGSGGLYEFDIVKSRFFLNYQEVDEFMDKFGPEPCRHLNFDEAVSLLKELGLRPATPAELRDAWDPMWFDHYYPCVSLLSSDDSMIHYVFGGTNPEHPPVHKPVFTMPYAKMNFKSIIFVVVRDEKEK